MTATIIWRLGWHFVVLAVLCWSAGCSSGKDSHNSAVDGNRNSPVFDDRSTETALTFEHTSGTSEKMLLPEIVGAGAALIDFDNDGDLDLYLLQSGPDVTAGSGKLGDSANKLFLNELVESGRLRFSDATDHAGVGHTGYAMGVAVGDYDNDGDSDFYVSNLGSNVLFRNDGGGRFTDVTAVARADDAGWSTSATFVDFDRDGFLDLFVANYVADSVTKHRDCVNSAGQRDYCSPTVFESTADRLFRNAGDGTFTDVTIEAGIGGVAGAGLGVLAADFDGDAWPDIFVANDQSANHLWRNQGNGQFEETGFISGSAYNAHGMAEAGMGVTAGDYDEDGDEDLFITHLNGQTNTLYTNDGKGNFIDSTDRSGLGAPSLLYTGWGSRWFDYDNDKLLDLYVANGAVFVEASAVGKSTFPYEQRNQLFHNQGDGRFQEIRDQSDETSEHRAISRGAAFGDVDNDGDIDILVANNSGPARLLINANANTNAWLTIDLQGTTSNRDGYGARVAVLQQGEPPRWQRCAADGSYLSSNDHRVHFGLSANESRVSVAILWPSGTQEIWRDVESRRIIALIEGDGEPWTKVRPQDRPERN